MALVKSDKGDIRVIEGAHIFTVGDTPVQIPDALVDAAVSQGCQLVDNKPASKAKPAPAKAE